MGKLTDMLAEPVSLPDRIKISAKRVRLAGIGLFSKVDAERTRLYRQIMELGESYGDDSGLVGQLTKLSTGTVHLVIEESQRVFDELVEAGEQAVSSGKPTLVAAPAKLNTPRPVAKTVAKPAAEEKVAEKAAPKPVAPVKAVAKPAVAKSNAKPAAKPAAKKPELKEVPKQPVTETAGSELKQSFDAAKARLGTLTAPPDQMSLLALYALFKQATDGDVVGRRPPVTKMVDRAKFDERQKLKGMSIVEAMERYIAKVNDLVPT